MWSPLTASRALGLTCNLLEPCACAANPTALPARGHVQGGLWQNRGNTACTFVDGPLERCNRFLLYFCNFCAYFFVACARLRMSGVQHADIDFLVTLCTPLDLTVTSGSLPIRPEIISWWGASLCDFLARFYGVIKSRNKIWAVHVAHGWEEKFLLGFGGEGWRKETIWKSQV